MSAENFDAVLTFAIAAIGGVFGGLITIGIALHMRRRVPRENPISDAVMRGVITVNEARRMRDAESCQCEECTPASRRAAK